MTKKTKKWEWRDGSPFSKLSASKVGERLEKLERENDGLTKMMILDDAESLDSPQHDAFDWDDSSAARKHRLRTAGKLIQEIKVIDLTTDASHRRFQVIRVVEGGPQVARRVEVIMNDETLRDRLIKKAKGEIEAFVARYNDLAELSDLMAAIEQELASLVMAPA